MADNVAITAGTGTNIAADEVVDGTLGTVKAQYVKVMDGTLDGTNKQIVDAAGYTLVKAAPRLATFVTGNQSLSISTSSTTLTVPATATHALISVDSGDVRFWEDGTAPTSTTGVLLISGSIIEISVTTSNVKFIQANTSVGAASLQVAYRKYV